MGAPAQYMRKISKNESQAPDYNIKKIIICNNRLFHYIVYKCPNIIGYGIKLFCERHLWEYFNAL